MWSLTGFLENLRYIYHHPKTWDTAVDPFGLFLIAVLLGVLTIAIYVNMGNVSDLTRPKAAIATGSGVKYDKNRPPIPPPTEIISLRIYPIKSCRGIEVDSTRLKMSGLTLDRNWMFIEPSDREFLTIRKNPSMTLIDTKIIDGEGEFAGQQMLEISAHNSDGRVVIPAFPSKTWLEAHTRLEMVSIWGEDTDGYVYGPEINNILSQFLQQEVELVYKGPTHRMMAINGRKELYGKETPFQFADVISIQIASEASIKDLNKRMGYEWGTPEAFTIERFRPNVIIKGRDDHPWEEDTWKRVRITTTLPHEEAIYKLDLDVVARCARCQVPNVNPETGEKHAKQPWATLMTFRRVDMGGVAKWKPCFGMMCIPKNEGKIAVGGVLEVLETTDRHLYDKRRFDEL